MVYNIIITGVGGQGSVLASRTIANAAMLAGYEVRTSDTIGMAQRGGSVISHVRFGHHIASPIIANGTGDILIGFELAEAVRAVNLLKPNATALVNKQIITPPSVYAGISQYDTHKVKTALQTYISNLFLINAGHIAREAGHWKSANIVLLGALSQIDGFPLTKGQLLEGVLNMVPARMQDVNQKAFNMGVSYMEDVKHGC